MPKKLPADVLEEAFKKYGRKVEKISEPFEALNHIIKKTEPSETLLVMGSHYLIGDLLNRYKIESNFEK